MIWGFPIGEGMVSDVEAGRLKEEKEHLFQIPKGHKDLPKGFGHCPGKVP